MINAILGIFLQIGQFLGNASNNNNNEVTEVYTVIPYVSPDPVPLQDEKLNFRVWFELNKIKIAVIGFFLSFRFCFITCSVNQKSK